MEDTVRPSPKGSKGGQPAFDPRLCLKVLVYGYCTGVRSSRRLEQYCLESLPFLFRTRGDTPSYRTLCTVRAEQSAYLEAVWKGLFAVAADAGIERVGRITVDSTKLRADVSGESVVQQVDFAAVGAELQRILDEAGVVDAREAAETGKLQLRTGTAVPREHMRDILRRVRRQPSATRATGAPDAPPVAPQPDPPSLPLSLPPLDPTPPEVAAPEAEMTTQMLLRVARGLVALQQATETGRKFVSLTDPDAEMMHGGAERRTQMCHSWEVATDAELLVASAATQSGNDNARLLPLLTAAQDHELHGVTAVTADSGYYAGDTIGKLWREGLDLCIPDSNTAGDLHRQQPAGTIRAKSQGRVPFEYDAEADLFRCPEGNQLTFHQQRDRAGQTVKI
ncbi:MAG: transposase [Actinomycetota bacterium]